MKRQMPATETCKLSVLVLYSCSLVYTTNKLCTNGDSSSLFLEPGIDVTKQCLWKSKYLVKSSALRPRVLVLRTYTTFDPVDETLLLPE